MRLRRFTLTVIFIIVLTGAVAAQTSDPLPSWNEGATKSAITGFVSRVTRDGSSDFVPMPERIAVFDNDGTLWCEQPVYFQAAFALDRIRAMAPQHPEWKQKQPFKAFLARDSRALSAEGHKGILTLMGAAHVNMTTDEFSRSVAEWLAAARHPRFERPYDQLVYQPMLELLTYLRANGFKTLIVSGGGVEFIRVWAEKAYGIPPEQVVGSSGATQLRRAANGKPELFKLPKIEFVDDGPGKPSGIHRFIGRRPIFAFGNSDGDLQMLQWVTTGDGPRFAALVHHTDAAREYAYDRQSKIGKLDKALDAAGASGWTVVDMKNDWKQVFAFEP